KLNRYRLSPAVKRQLAKMQPGKGRFSTARSRAKGVYLLPQMARTVRASGAPLKGTARCGSPRLHRGSKSALNLGRPVQGAKRRSRRLRAGHGEVLATVLGETSRRR